MNIFFSSDWHFGHQNIAGPKISSWSKGFRDFDSVSDMDRVLLDSINKTVGPDDVIFFLGDFCFGGHVRTPLYRDRIVCQNIYWLKGNHDQHQPKYKDKFLWVGDNDEIIDKVNRITIEPYNAALVTVRGQKIVLSHFKHAIWEGSHKGYWHLYGHSHSSAEHWEIGKSMDVGVDNAYRLLGEYRPFSLEEIGKFMSQREIHNVDHHDKNTNVR
jgi:calcineurin-like phosphoesterase family protein